MIKRLGKKGIRIPNGFATTSKAYWYFLDENKLREPINGLLEQLDTDDFSNLASIGSKIRNKILSLRCLKNWPKRSVKLIKNCRIRKKGCKVLP
jgi:pyruvate, water dikinase